MYDKHFVRQIKGIRKILLRFTSQLMCQNALRAKSSPATVQLSVFSFTATLNIHYLPFLYNAIIVNPCREIVKLIFIWYIYM